MSMKNNYERLVKHRFKEILKWRRSGKGIYQISELLGISYPSMLNYRKEYPEFQAVLDEGKQGLLENLETSLFEKAMGGIVRETTKVQHNSETGETITTTTTMTTDVDTTALIFALKTNYPEIYAAIDGRENEEVVNAIDNLAKGLLEGLDLDED